VNRAFGSRPAAYVLRIGGHLDPHWSARLGGLELTHDSDGTTTLTGAVADQAELHGILTRIRDLGVTLISVAPVDPPEAHDGAEPVR
jgi:hypothetical protein